MVKKMKWKKVMLNVDVGFLFFSAFSSANAFLDEALCAVTLSVNRVKMNLMIESIEFKLLFFDVGVYV